MYRLIVVLLFLIAISKSNLISQNVAINDNGAVGNSNAILDFDVSTNNKGLLIPRITTAQRTSITGLVAGDEGLMVYDETAKAFYFWTGTAWGQTLTSAAGWQTLGNANTVDGTHFIGTTDNIPLNLRVNNQKAGRIDALGNVFLGYQAGNSNTATTNTGMGYQALYTNTNGYYNVAMGYQALYTANGESDNTAIGYQTLFSTTYGNYNTAIGAQALYFNTSANYNTATGYRVLYSNTTGAENTALGYNAGYSNSVGNGNVFIGHDAGYSETGSNKLYIANSSTNPPLIYGDFATGRVGIGTITPTEKLELCGNLKVIGTINASSTINASQSITCSSDIRYKKEITPLYNSLSNLMKLKGVN